MTDLYRQMWQHMNGRERASLVRKFFFTVVLTKSDCLDWLDEKDYEEMQKFTYMVYTQIEYTIMLGCHCFYYSKNWKPSSDEFKNLFNFLENHLNQKSGEHELPLFGKINTYRMVVDIPLNPQAFFQWLATHDLVTWDLVKH